MIEKNAQSLRSTPGKEFASSYLHGMNPFGAVANLSGIIKAITDPPEENAAKSGVDNLMPSVGSYRLINRLKAQAYKQDEKHKGHAKHNYLSEVLGTFSSGAAATMLGGAIGAYRGLGGPAEEMAKKVMHGMGAGAAVATAANLLAMIGSAVTRRRTESEQVEHDERRRWENYILPGFAAYDRGKRAGRSEGDYEEHPELHKKMEEEIASREKKESAAKKIGKAVAAVVGTGMAAYGIYKMPSVIKGNAVRMIDRFRAV